LAGTYFITALYPVTFIASTVKFRNEGGQTKLLGQKMEEKIPLQHSMISAVRTAWPLYSLLYY